MGKADRMTEEELEYIRAVYPCVPRTWPQRNRSQSWPQPFCCQGPYKGNGTQEGNKDSRVPQS